MRYNFVSYSQLGRPYLRIHSGCLWYVWDTILSAIHNPVGVGRWSVGLFVICMRYNFVSYSQRRACIRHRSSVVCDMYEIQFCQHVKEQNEVFTSLYMQRYRFIGDIPNILEKTNSWYLTEQLPQNMRNLWLVGSKRCWPVGKWDSKVISQRTGYLFSHELHVPDFRLLW